MLSPSEYRFIIERTIFDRYVEAYAKAAAALPVLRGKQDGIASRRRSSCSRLRGRSLWASSNADAPQGLGDPTLEAMNSTRLTGGMNRGYSTIDFVDYLDALKCDGVATSAQIDAVRDAFSFYYDHAQTCP